MFEYLNKFFDIMFKLCLGVLGLFLFLMLWMWFSPKPGDTSFIDLARQSGIDSATAQNELPKTWPPKLGESFPDLTLIDQNGAKFRLSALKGKVLLIQFVNMKNPVSQAFSGANELGAYMGAETSSNVQVFWKLLPDYAKGVKFPNNNVRIVQILLYSMSLGPPKAEDVQKWAEHFRLYPKDGHIVAASPYDLRGPETAQLTPGFMLVDQNFIVRGDATGTPPHQNLYQTVLPMLASLVLNSGTVTDLGLPAPLDLEQKIDAQPQQDNVVAPDPASDPVLNESPLPEPGVPNE